VGSSYRHRCDGCGYEVSTSGAWEFYRDRRGRRRPYGHPVPRSETARRRGIYGLSVEVYCPGCDKVSDAVLVEFVKPCHESIMVWSGQCEPKEEFRREDAVRCPRCGSTDLLLEAVDEKEVACPRCRKGRLIGWMEWIS